jgi:SAM-dependent methyltransferase
MTTTEFEPGSFRDRQGRIFYRDVRVYRALSETAFADWQALSTTRFYSKAREDGRIVGTREVDDPQELLENVAGPWVAALEHDRIPFISYPYEWTFGMLRDAALLHLDLILDALEEDLILKDASAYNLQFRGARPVHIDVSSFERWQPGEPWVGYRQFCQLFLYPLFMTAYRRLPFQPWLRGAIDGITPQQCQRLLSLRDHLRRGVLTHVYLQSKLLSATAGSARDIRAELKETGLGKQLIARNARSLRKVVAGLTLADRRSEWSAYADDTVYSDDDEQAKRRFVADAVASETWPLVWDLGCNTGAYSRIAAARADCVIAMDADHLSVERLYRELRSEGDTTILPLVMNLVDPSPGLGWRGAERGSLSDRGTPDLVLCLALLHHLVISANVPLAEIVDWLASLGARLVVEFVDKSDPMVRRLLLRKEDVYDDYTVESFETLCGRHFNVLSSLTVCGGARHLFFLAPKRRADRSPAAV